MSKNERMVMLAVAIVGAALLAKYAHVQGRALGLPPPVVTGALALAGTIAHAS
jgi:hypothetical protein